MQFFRTILDQIFWTKSFSGNKKIVAKASDIQIGLKELLKFSKIVFLANLHHFFQLMIELAWNVKVSFNVSVQMVHCFIT